MRDTYDALMSWYATKHRNLFNPDGSRCTGNSSAGMFWRGYDGTTLGKGFTDRASRQTLAYAAWRAGQDAKAADSKQEKGAKA